MPPICLNRSSQLAFQNSWIIFKDRKLILTYVKINELRHSAHIASRQFVLVGLYQLQVGTFLQVECSDFVHISVKLFERDASRKVCCLDEVIKNNLRIRVCPTHLNRGR